MVRGYSLIALAGFGVQIVQAGFSSQCINLKLRGTWLVADCLTGSGTTRIQSSVYLNNKLVNNNGVLRWQQDGRYAASCQDCALVAPAKLNCMCRPSGGRPIAATINLEEHIANYNGHLLTDLNGTPTPPSVPSAFNFPADPSWRMYTGNVSCWIEDPPTPGSVCPNPGVGEGSTCGSSPFISSTEMPFDCYVFRWPVHTVAGGTWGSARAEAPSGAYSFEFYDNRACSGAPAGVLVPSEYGTCKEFRHQMLAVSSIPLWNADW